MTKKLENKVEKSLNINEQMDLYYNKQIQINNDMATLETQVNFYTQQFYDFHKSKVYLYTKKELHTVQFHISSFQQMKKTLEPRVLSYGYKDDIYEKWFHLREIEENYKQVKDWLEIMYRTVMYKDIKEFS